MGLNLKAVFIGILLIFILSVPAGYYLANAYETMLAEQGVSFTESSVEEIELAAAKIEFKPIMLFFHMVISLITISVPALVSAKISEVHCVRNALAIGVISVLVFLVGGGIYQSNLFVLFIVCLNMIAAYFPGILVSRFWSE